MDFFLKSTQKNSGSCLTRPPSRGALQGKTSHLPATSTGTEHCHKVLARAVRQGIGLTGHYSPGAITVTMTSGQKEGLLRNCKKNCWKYISNKDAGY